MSVSPFIFNFSKEILEENDLFERNLTVNQKKKNYLKRILGLWDSGGHVNFFGKS